MRNSSQLRGFRTERRTASQRWATRQLAAAGTLFAATALVAPPAVAQQQARGFALERLYPAAPGGGWFVMDALDMHGGIGGVAGLSVGYAHNPLRVHPSSGSGSRDLSVVAGQASANLGIAVTYERWRLYLNLDMPIAVAGNSGAAGSYAFRAPDLDLGSHPDSILDPRFGLDVRVLGEATSPARVGLSAQLIAPNGVREEYGSDGSFRAMFRALFAGDVDRWTYAAHAGVHVRPLNDAPTPGSPEGGELLFGIASGVKFPLPPRMVSTFVIGPELFAATPFRAPFGSETTALETLVTGRIEGTGDRGGQLRLKLGGGGGLNAHFGAPEWRVIVGIELFDHNARVEPTSGCAQPY